jgi:hypothetical protein
MSDETDVSEEFKDNFIRQFFDLWINPELIVAGQRTYWISRLRCTQRK